MSVSAVMPVDSRAATGPGDHDKGQTQAVGVFRYYRDLRRIQRVRRDLGGEFARLKSEYTPLIMQIVKGFYLPSGGDRQDLYQEGLIGLYKAVCDYDGRSSFNGFARLCIQRQVITAIVKAGRRKHQAINRAYSIHGDPHDDDGGIIPYIAIPDIAPVVIRRMEAREHLEELVEAVNTRLSEIERSVLQMWWEDVPYVEMARQLKRDRKAVDNALQRAIKKLEAVRRAQIHGLPMPGSTIRTKPDSKMQQLIRHLASIGGEIKDPKGRVTKRLSSALGQSSEETSQLLYRAAKRGIITKTSRPRGTYSVRLVEPGQAS